MLKLSSSSSSSSSRLIRSPQPDSRAHQAALPRARTRCRLEAALPAPSAAAAAAPPAGASASPASSCSPSLQQRAHAHKPVRTAQPAVRMAAAAAAAPEAPSNSSSKTVLVPIGTGTEEMEAVIIIDVLRRAGADVVLASVEPELQVTCSRGVKLVADALIGDAATNVYDLIALPGGMPGAEQLRDCAPLEALLRAQIEGGRLYAAICATPAVFLQAKGMLEGKAATSHPGFSAQLQNQSSVETRVVVDGKLTTSRGPGTAFEFALSLVGQLFGREKMEAVAGPMVMYPYALEKFGQL